jgi:hypothetical protein
VIPIIEVFGLPGSGKTHFVSEIRKHNNEHHLHFLSAEQLAIRGLQQRNDGRITDLVKKLPPICWHSIINEDYCLQEYLNFSSSNVELFKLIFSVLTKAKVTTNHYRSILGAFSRTTIAYEFASIYENTVGEVLLADEWFCHRFYTLFGNSCVVPSSEQVYEYIKLIPLSSVVVFITTSPEECMQRMTQRNRFPVLLSELSPENIERRMGNAFRSLKELSSMLRTQGRKIVEYNGHLMCHKKILEDIVTTLNPSKMNQR